MEDETYSFTAKGWFFAMEVHQKTLDGWTLEQLASFYDYEVYVIRVLLAAFYDTCEKNNIDLGVYIPDTPEGLI